MKMTIVRTEYERPSEEAMKGARQLLFQFVDGFGDNDKRSWRKFWKRIVSMEIGELIQFDMKFPRSGKFHRLHMSMEQHIFDHQERFVNFEMFRDWLKIAAGHVMWVQGPKGGIVPIPKSISYTEMDDEEFAIFHKNSVAFLLTETAAKTLWPKLPADQREEALSNLMEGYL